MVSPIQAYMLTYIENVKISKFCIVKCVKLKPFFINRITAQLKHNQSIATMSSQKSVEIAMENVDNEVVKTVKASKLSAKNAKFEAVLFWHHQQLLANNVIDESQFAAMNSAIQLYKNVDEKTEFYESFASALSATTKAIRKNVSESKKPKKEKKEKKAKKAIVVEEGAEKTKRGRAKKTLVVNETDALIVQMVEVANTIVAPVANESDSSDSETDTQHTKKLKIAKKHVRSENADAQLAEKAAKALAEKEEKTMRVLAEKEEKAMRVLAEKEEKATKALADKEAKATKALAEKEEKAAKALAEKEAKAAKALAEKEAKAAKALVEKEEKAARVLAEKEAKKTNKKSTVAAESTKVDVKPELVVEPIINATEEEEDEATEITINGKQYLMDDDFNLYDYVTNEYIGKTYDEASNTIIDA